MEGTRAPRTGTRVWCLHNTSLSSCLSLLPSLFFFMYWLHLLSSLAWHRPCLRESIPGTDSDELYTGLMPMPGLITVAREREAMIIRPGPFPISAARGQSLSLGEREWQAKSVATPGHYPCVFLCHPFLHVCVHCFQSLVVKLRHYQCRHETRNTSNTI